MTRRLHKARRLPRRTPIQDDRPNLNATKTRDVAMPTDGGFVNVYKPIGLGSTQTVGRVRRALGVRRVGHCGTLDPLAWGVLPLAVGRATRLSRFILEMPKVYQAVVLFGLETPSFDLETHPVAAPSPPPSPKAVADLLPTFTGVIQQHPPAYSAIQVGGVRAYRAVRAGRQPNLRPRQVRISALDLVAAGRIGVNVCDGRLHFGCDRGSSDALLVGLRIECSSGTYIRALARDLGAALGCGATLFGLVRSRVGPFTIGAATEIWQLDAASRGGYLDTLLYAPDVAVEHLPVAVLSDEDRVDFSHGRTLNRLAAGLHRLYDGRGDFLGLALGEAGRWIPRVVWRPA